MDIERIKKLSGLTEALGYHVPDDRFDSQREQEFQTKVDEMLFELQDVERKLKTFTLSPSTTTEVDAAMRTIIGVFEELSRHARNNLKPANMPKRRR